MGARFADHERLPIGRYDHPIREPQPIGSHAHLTLGRNMDQSGRTGLFAGMSVEAKITNIGATSDVDYHIVAPIVGIP